MKTEEAIKASGGEFYDREKAHKDPEFRAQMEAMRRDVGKFFDILEGHAGNEKESVEAAMDTTLAELQGRVIRYVGQFAVEDAEAVSRALVILSVMISVVMNNPMYSSHALRLQLQAELDRHIREASAIKLR